MRLRHLLPLFFAVLAVSAQGADKKPILLVLTNNAKLGDTGKTTGFFLSEAAHPWEVFHAAGYPVQLASPGGGFAPVDPKSLDLKDAANAAFWKEYGGKDGAGEGVAKTLALKDAKAGDYAAIFFAGGHGTMWDFPDSRTGQALTAKIYEQGGAVGAVCHGPAALVKVHLADGSFLVKGKRVAVFTNAEEDAVGLAGAVPFLLQNVLEENGAIVVPGENFKANAIRDGRLVTGQNPASAAKTAQLLVEALGG